MHYALTIRWSTQKEKKMHFYFMIFWFLIRSFDVGRIRRVCGSVERNEHQCGDVMRIQKNGKKREGSQQQ
jgi:hypothetical protein